MFSDIAGYTAIMGGGGGRKSLHGYVSRFNLALVYLGTGDRERAMDCLEQAYSAHSVWLFFAQDGSHI
jgi:hypothetical protein